MNYVCCIYQLAIPSDSARLQNIMEFQMSQSDEDVRTFVLNLEGTIGDQALNQVLDSLDEVEAETGFALTFGDNPPYQKFVESMKVHPEMDHTTCIL